MTRILAILLLCLCAIGDASAAGVLRRGNAWEPASVDPHKIQSSQEFTITLDMFEGLTALTVDGKPEPAVAQSWTTSPDSRTWTFTLRPNLKWSDGTPLTADDVVFSFRRLLDPSTAATFASAAYMISNARAVNTNTMPVDKLGVSAPNANTIVIALEYPAPYLPQLLARASFVIVPRAAVTKNPDDWMRAERAVSNGAFVLKERVPNSHIVMERNPHYRAPATLDAVIYETNPDLEVGVTRFRAGSVDIQMNLAATKIAGLQKELPKEIKLTRGEPTIVYLAPNMTNPKFSDVRVRRALSLAIDRKALVDGILRGGQLPAETFVAEGFAGYQPPDAAAHRRPLAERVKQAKALLVEAGITPASPLRISYRFNGTNVETKNVGVGLQAMWKPLGVILELEGTESKVLFADLSKSAFEITYQGYRPEYPDPAAYLALFESTNYRNYGKYNNAAFDDLIARGRQSTDTAVRHDLFRKAEALLLDAQAVIPLYFGGVGRQLVSQRVRGWQSNPELIHLSRYMSLEGAN